MHVETRIIALAEEHFLEAARQITCRLLAFVVPMGQWILPVGSARSGKQQAHFGDIIGAAVGLGSNNGRTYSEAPTTGMADDLSLARRPRVADRPKNLPLRLCRCGWL